MTQDSEIPRRSRRRFLYEMGVTVIGGFVSLITAGALIGYFVDVLMKFTSLQWVTVCSLDQVDTVEPREFRVAFKGENASAPSEVAQGVFVIRQGNQILAFTNTCTHMGCAVRWLAWRQQILCPCHGGIYDRWGQLMGGPPSVSLPFYLTRIQGNDVQVANRTIDRGNVLLASSRIGRAKVPERT